MAKIKLSTGREFQTHGSVLGLRYQFDTDTKKQGFDWEDLVLFQGYDNSVLEGWPKEYSGDLEFIGGPGTTPFTPAERREIADRMIQVWNLWAGAAK